MSVTIAAFRATTYCEESVVKLALFQSRTCIAAEFADTALNTIDSALSTVQRIRAGYLWGNRGVFRGVVRAATRGVFRGVFRGDIVRHGSGLAFGRRVA